MDPRVEMLYTDLEDVKDQMEQNAFQMTTQIVNLEELHEKTQELEKSSETFKKESSRLKKVFYCKELKLKLMIVGIGTMVIGGLILIMVLTSLYGKTQ